MVWVVESCLIGGRSADGQALMKRSLQYRLSRSAASHIVVQHFAILARHQIGVAPDPTPWIEMLEEIKTEIVETFADKAGWSKQHLYPPSFVLNVFVQMHLQARKFFVF